MARPLYPLVDRLLGGKLTERLTEKRADRQSYDEIARWLATEHGIDVTAETVRAWCAKLDIPAKAAS